MGDIEEIIVGDKRAALLLVGPSEAQGRFGEDEGIIIVGITAIETDRTAWEMRTIKRGEIFFSDHARLDADKVGEKHILQLGADLGELGRLAEDNDDFVAFAMRIDDEVIEFLKGQIGEDVIDVVIMEMSVMAEEIPEGIDDHASEGAEDHGHNGERNEEEGEDLVEISEDANQPVRCGIEIGHEDGGEIQHHLP